uniref:Uncharacterized protein n=1 Tax=Rhizophora mucronata TaxID=61149 RepID=A0A2P2QSV0_RHIMU
MGRRKDMTNCLLTLCGLCRVPMFLHSIIFYLSCFDM